MKRIQGIPGLTLKHDFQYVKKDRTNVWITFHSIYAKLINVETSLSDHAEKCNTHTS
tara:strand:- start:243 stop:413 length:171 start_codon:yes stop_codon:yes gene_type:complete